MIAHDSKDFEIEWPIFPVTKIKMLKYSLCPRFHCSAVFYTGQLANRLVYSTVSHSDTDL